MICLEYRNLVLFCAFAPALRASEPFMCVTWTLKHVQDGMKTHVRAPSPAGMELLEAFGSTESILCREVPADRGTVLLVAREAV